MFASRVIDAEREPSKLTTWNLTHPGHALRTPFMKKDVFVEVKVPVGFASVTGE
jgi:hypothetical protein